LSLEKYIFIAAMILTACGLVCGMFCGLGGTYSAVSTVMSLMGLAGVIYIWHCWSTMNKSLRSVVDMLRDAKPGRIKANHTPAMKPLCDAVIGFADVSSKRADVLEKELGESALEIQLLQRQKQNAEAIIYSIRDAVIVTDAFDRLITANAAAEKFFGFDINNANCRPIDKLIEDTEFVKLIVRSRRGKLRHVKHEVPLISQDRDNRTFDCIISCVQEDNGLISGVVTVLHDMTREKEISRMKNEFVSHVSHELKTPLASINAYAEMLVDGELSDAESINRFCSVIQSQAQRLNRLIDDILNISRIESGLVKVQKQPLSLAILIKDAVDMIKSCAQEKNITIDEQAPIIFDRVYADKDMISQVIVNLLSNAIKYTPQGGSVSVRSEVNDADGIARLTVTDTGVGIPSEDIEHIFDRFYRVDANEKCAEGTGLGLNLVQQIVEKVHDGRMFVSSEPDRGSTFGFEMPLAAGKAVETS